MRDGRSFMTLIFDWCDVEKYQLKWLSVLWLCERTWVLVLWISFMCYLSIIILMIWLITFLMI